MNMNSRHPRHLKGFYSRKIGALYDRRRKLINRLIVSTASVVGIVVVAGFIPFSTAMLRDKVVKACEMTLADSCSVKRITLTPWLGFSIDSLTLLKRNNGVVLQATIPRLRLSYRIAPLLFRYVIIKDLVCKHPKLSIVSPASSPAPKQAGKRLSIENVRQALSSFPLTVVVRAISVENGDISVDEQHGNSLVAGTGVDVAMKVTYSNTLELAGRITCRKVRLSGLWDMTNLRAKFDMRDFDVVLSNCSGDFYGGKISASGTAELGLGTLKKFDFELSHVNMKKLYEGSRIGRGECSGRLDAKLELDKSRMDPDSLTGKGDAVLSDLNVHDLPIQNSLIVLVAIPKLRNISFSRFGADLIVRNGKIYTPHIEGEGDPLAFNSEGYVSFDGYFSEKCDGIFSRDFVGSLPSIVERSLDDAQDGKKSFKFTVSGKFKNPQIAVDQKIVHRAVDNVIGDVVKELGRLFKK
jgi:AsmA-like C-terminal region